MSKVVRSISSWTRTHRADTVHVLRRMFSPKPFAIILLSWAIAIVIGYVTPQAAGEYAEGTLMRMRVGLYAAVLLLLMLAWTVKEGDKKPVLLGLAIVPAVIMSFVLVALLLLHAVLALTGVV